MKMQDRQSREYQKPDSIVPQGRWLEGKHMKDFIIDTRDL